MNKDCFKPIVGKNPKILILGTFPGDESLEKQEYYASNRNCFWYVMEHLLNHENAFDSYEQKVKALISNNIALWDILDTCNRKGSLDINITNPICNDIVTFLKEHPSISCIVFNGNKAKGFFTSFFPSSLKVEYKVAPSTSNAYAIDKEEKVRKWKDILFG